eukprot:SAG31_NODE_623_length_13492_cov_62.118196_13_plen_302_part_00
MCTCRLHDNAVAGLPNHLPQHRAHWQAAGHDGLADVDQDVLVASLAQHLLRCRKHPRAGKLVLRLDRLEPPLGLYLSSSRSLQLLLLGLPRCLSPLQLRLRRLGTTLALGLRVGEATRSAAQLGTRHQLLRLPRQLIVAATADVAALPIAAQPPRVLALAVRVPGVCFAGRPIGRAALLTAGHASLHRVRRRLAGGGADLQRTQLFWPLRTGARGRTEAAAAGVAAAAAWAAATIEGAAPRGAARRPARRGPKFKFIRSESGPDVRVHIFTVLGALRSVLVHVLCVLMPYTVLTIYIIISY